jgi:hypothetical protein
MQPDDLKFPALFHEGKVWFLKRAEEHTGSYFGGPFEGEVRVSDVPVRSLHHIATITGRCFEPLRHVIGGGTICLFYGITHSGCRLQYRVLASDIELLQLDPEAPLEGWPYPNYPAYLPYFPLELDRVVDCEFEEFCELSCQRLEHPGSDALIIVPPSPVLGMSMWGPSGDMECVQIVFRYSLESHIVDAFNQCG